MFPKINNEYLENVEDEKSVNLGKCFKFDFENGRHIIVDGNFVECDFKENIQHFINVVLRTKLNTFKVYTEDEEEDFGLSIYNHIGNKEYHKGFIMSEAKREITEQLLNHPFIKDISDFIFNFKDTVLTITFSCTLENSETITIQEVID